MSNQTVKVLVGTRKGGFIFTSDQDQRQWSASDVLFKSWLMMHMMLADYLPPVLSVETAVV